MLYRVILSFSACLPLILLAGVFSSQAALAANDQSAKRAQVVSHWTPERRAAAIPRDLVIDNRGLGYLRRADGTLVPHGHRIEATGAATPAPKAKPGSGGNDTTPPIISSLDPDGITIGDSYTFSANVIDTQSGLKSVRFVIVTPGGSTQSFSPTSSGDIWSIGLSGFTDGNWSWRVEAKDSAKRGGNSSSEAANFTVSTGGGGGGGGGTGDTVINERYNGNGDVQTAAGRIYFEMPSNKGRKRWAGYVCSGTVVTDGPGNGRSTILTAAHCVYDDANKAFARNVLFIPDQDGTTGGGTDRNCSNDPIGCWTPSFGVVDVNWTQAVFPNNIPWDYAFYVVNDTGSHDPGSADLALDGDLVNELTVSFTNPSVDDGTAGPGTADFTHGMGYSYSDDPFFMYCAEDMTTEGTDNWWLPSCGLSGGSSGGPWIQPLGNDGRGPVISVNSWGYTSSPGMAGPKLNDSASTARCVFDAAIARVFPANVADGDAGYAIDCP